MSASMTVSDVNQGLSLGALGAWLVGVPSEVVIGGLAGAVIFVTFAAEYPIKAETASFRDQLLLRASLLQTNGNHPHRSCSHTSWRYS